MSTSPDETPDSQETRDTSKKEPETRIHRRRALALLLAIAAGRVANMLNKPNELENEVHLKGSTDQEFIKVLAFYAKANLKTLSIHIHDGELEPRKIESALRAFVSGRKRNARSHMTVTIMIHRGDDTDRRNAEKISRLVQGIAHDESTTIDVQFVRDR